MGTLSTVSPAACVVFDFDGVLVDSNRIKREGFLAALTSLGAPAVEQSRLLDQAPPGDRTVILPWLRDESARAGWLPQDAPESSALVAEYTRYCEEAIAACAEVPGATDALTRLAAGRPLYVNSATPRETLIRIVDRRGWSGYFAAVLGRPTDKVGNFTWIARREGIPASAMLFIGDQRSDYEAACAVGCQFLGYRSPESDLVPGQVEELASLLALCDRLASV